MKFNLMIYLIRYLKSLKYPNRFIIELFVSEQSGIIVCIDITFSYYKYKKLQSMENTEKIKKCKIGLLK